nr:hypothetical protein [Tanacetum cinerariifolium]
HRIIIYVFSTHSCWVRVPTVATTIPAGSSVDAVVYAAAAPSSSIPTAADKGKAPIDELAKKIHAEQEVEFSRQQEELAQKAQAESVASPIEHGPGMSDQQDNMNECLGMLLLCKRRELAEQSRVKPMTKTQQRDYMRDFVKNNSASVRSTFRPKPTLDAPPAKRANQGALQVPAVSSQDPAGVPAAPSIPADVSLPAAPSFAPADILVPTVSIANAAVSVPAEPMVHPAKSHMDDPLTAPEHGSSEPTVATPTPSSSCHRRKHIAKKRGTPIVDVADVAMIKFDSDSDSDDDPLPYAPYVGWEMVPSPLGSVHAYHDMAGHTKYFTT